MSRTGQSNMVRPVDWANSSASEMRQAATYDMIRLFQAEDVDSSHTVHHHPALTNRHLNAANPGRETVQGMFITLLYRQHASHTLASRAFGPQPHMRSSPWPY